MFLSRKTRRRGEIGRRKGLKIPRWQHRTGSSPVTGTNTRKPQYLQGFSGFCFVKNHPKIGQKSDLKKGSKMGTSLQHPSKFPRKILKHPVGKLKMMLKKHFFEAVTASENVLKLHLPSPLLTKNQGACKYLR